MQTDVPFAVSAMLISPLNNPGVSLSQRKGPHTESVIVLTQSTGPVVTNVPKTSNVGVRGGV